MGRNTAQVGLIGMAVGIVFVAATGSTGAQTHPAPEPCAVRDAVPLQLRPLDCRLAAVIADGLKRSATFHHLVERVGTLNGIVYIHLRPYVKLDGTLVQDGALLHSVTTAGAYRVLHVIVNANRGDRPIVILAHEFQHAIEVLEAADVSTENAVDQLFERIGFRVYGGAVETRAALDVEDIVKRELSRRDWVR